MSDAQTVQELDVSVETKNKQQSKKQPNRSKPKKQPPYAVIIHNDEAHTFPYVIEAIQKVCGHNRTKATLMTEQIHFQGLSHVWTGSLEVAELKRDQIRGLGTDFYAPNPVKFPLGVTIEPLPAD
jgi:ATP-dependent Clp protease adaptor protein ClpS